MSVLFLSVMPPVCHARFLLGAGCTLFATTECSREIRVSVPVAVPEVAIAGRVLLGGSLSLLGEDSEFLGFAPTSLDMPRSGVFTEMLEIALNRTGGSFLDHVVSMS